MKTRMDKSICSWWDGPCLFEVLDRIVVPLRDPKGSVRLVLLSCNLYTALRKYIML
jgi:peptide chain release factor subunit 3